MTENEITVGTPTAEQLEKINKFTRRQLNGNEVYVFSVVLCDNEIDRDFERFSEDSLEKMAELFIGKSGIFDHSAKSGDQCARIFETEIEKTESLTTDGRPYLRLKASAYMPKLESNKWLIDEIDAGIKKEVSVGCSMGRSVCSVCGTSVPHCSHKKGRTYSKHGKKTLCFYTLEDPKDAYEWSFVAIPAQRKAGVTKSFNGRKDENTLEFNEILKSMTLGEEITISGETAKQFAAVTLAAEEFLKTKRAEFVASLSLPATSGEIVSKALSLISPDELIALCKEAETKTDEVKPQLAYRIQATKNTKNDKFKI